MSKSIAEIKKEFEQTALENRSVLYEEYAADSRLGVQGLIKKYQKEEKQLERAGKTVGNANV